MNTKIQNAISRLTVVSCVLSGLPESPGYNGSRLIIDDDEAEDLIKDINSVIEFLNSHIEPEKEKTLEGLSRPLIKWLNDNMHPHAKIIIDPTYFELVEGVEAKTVYDYVKD
jgi:hypothetical protein